MDEILVLKNVNKHFGGIHAVKDVSLRFNEGKVCALMGENGAGKSTLGKMIAGIYALDSGEIRLNGEKLVFDNPLEAQKKGIGLVLQELDVFPSLSVAQNIILNNMSFAHLEKGFLNSNNINEEVKPWLEKVRLDVNPGKPMEELSMAQIQLVVIARILSMNCRLIIMDEPTSSLTDDAVDNLFSLIRDLKKDNVTIIYVSHKMNEIFQIADEIAVMRDGEFIGKKSADETDPTDIIEMMVGRTVSGKEKQRSWATGDVCLSVRNLITPKMKDVSFDLHKGEVLGVAGLVGAGRTELGEALFGLEPVRSGSIRTEDGELELNNPGDAIKKGIGFIPEDRKLQGLMMSMSVQENMILSTLDDLNRKGFLDNSKIVKNVDSLIDNIRIKTPSGNSCVDTLSGGNQQKVLVARWLMVDPEVLFLDDPTRGVDVGAKEDIYEIITSLASRGKGLIFVSSELPELLRCCDRIMVLSEGRATAVLKCKETTQQEIMSYATASVVAGSKNKGATR
ncbi:MAG: sugar ABC transporter ATP-binding protein [Spirochaetales bacterium]|nr:sugar ABC transporter ATP-binding protein [Spirochaetales bacterium]